MCQPDSTTTTASSSIKIFGKFFIQFFLRIYCDESFELFDIDIITQRLLSELRRAFAGWDCVRIEKVKLRNSKTGTIKTKRSTNDRQQIEGIVQLFQTNQYAPTPNTLLTYLREQVIQRDSMLKQGNLTSMMTRDSITDVRRMYRCSADDNIDSFSDTCHSLSNGINSLHIGLIIGFSILGLIIFISILCACCFYCIRLST